MMQVWSNVNECANEECGEEREREKIETRLFNVQDDFQIDNITVEHFRSAL